jgi:hypothetical protein
MVGIWIEHAAATGNTGMIRKKVWSLLREKPGNDLAPGTQNSILKQTGLK